MSNTRCRWTRKPRTQSIVNELIQSMGVDWEFDDATYSKISPELYFDFTTFLKDLKRDVGVPDLKQLRLDHRYKQEWDTGSGLTRLKTIASLGFSKEEDDETKKYIETCAKSQARIYTDSEQQLDPMFAAEPNMKKVLPPLPKLAEVAVECHNFITGSKLEFEKIVKANLLMGLPLHVYFITLEAFDKSSNKGVTCQTRVACVIENWHDINIKDDPLVILSTLVNSFKVKKI